MAECNEDKDMLSMAYEEMARAVEEERRLRNLLLKSLLPKDDADERDCILEVRAGKCKRKKKKKLKLSRHTYSALVFVLCVYVLIPFKFTRKFEQEPEGKRLRCLRWTFSRCKLQNYTVRGSSTKFQCKFLNSHFGLALSEFQ